MTMLEVNGKKVVLEADPDTPLLWALRDELSLTGTKFGCGRAFCGACTVHLDQNAARSCSILVRTAAGRRVTTIEGLTGPIAEAVRAAWIEAQIPQCGYCQPGFVMAITSLIASTDGRSGANLASQVTNICRCGTYDAIRSALSILEKTLPALSQAPEMKP